MTSIAPRTLGRSSLARLALWRVAQLALVWVCWSWCVEAGAQTGVRALPAVWLAPRLVEPGDHSLRLGLDLGYGALGAVAATGGTHHRARGGVGVAYAAPFGLGLELRLDGRWDVHDVPKQEDSLVGEPRLFVRYHHAVGPRTQLGLEAALWVPGASAPSLRFSALSVDLLAALDVALPRRLGLVIALGPRIDRSARSVSDSLNLSRSDQISLGVSSFHALLARVALETSLGGTKLALELSGDVLLGARAPSVGRSPLRAAVALRQPLAAGVELTALVAALLSARPPLRDGTDYAPFEPRVQAVLGARYVYQPAKPTLHAPTTKPAAMPARPPVSEPEPQPEPAKIDAALLVSVVNTQGEPLPDVRVALEPGDELRTGGAGTARFSGLARGERALSVSADGFVAQELRAHIADALTTELRVVLETAQQESVLRVLVRDAERGTPVTAQLTINPQGASKIKRVQVSTAADGSFERTLPAGRYRVELRAAGYQAQTRSVEVLERGVTLFNVDLSPVAR